MVIPERILTIEGFNANTKPTSRKMYDFRTFKIKETSLYKALVNLLTPDLIHEIF